MSNSSKTTTAIRNANLDLTLKKKLAGRNPRNVILTLLPKLNAGSIINKSVIIINQRINQLTPISVNTDLTLVPNYFTNVQIPRYIIDLLRDLRLSVLNLDTSGLTINFGEIPFEFINGIKIINKAGGAQTIVLNSVQTISFPLEPYRFGVPNVNKISFSPSSQIGDYILITWYNTPLINLAPGYRVVTNNNNIIYNSLDN